MSHAEIRVLYVNNGTLFILKAAHLEAAFQIIFKVMFMQQL